MIAALVAFLMWFEVVLCWSVTDFCKLTTKEEELYLDMEFRRWLII